MKKQLEERILEKYNLMEEDNENSKNEAMCRFVYNMQKGFFKYIYDKLNGKEEYSKDDIAKKLIDIGICEKGEDTSDLVKEVLSTKFFAPFCLPDNYYTFEKIPSTDGKRYCIIAHGYRACLDNLGKDGHLHPLHY